MNTNGSIDYTEFIAGCMRSKIYLKEDHLRSAFEYFDRVRRLSLTGVGQKWKHHSGWIEEGTLRGWNKNSRQWDLEHNEGGRYK